MGPKGQHIDTGNCYDQSESVCFFSRIHKPGHKGEGRGPEDGEQHSEKVHSRFRVRHPNMTF